MPGWRRRRRGYGPSSARQGDRAVAGLISIGDPQLIRAQIAELNQERRRLLEELGAVSPGGITGFLDQLVRPEQVFDRNRLEADIEAIEPMIERLRRALRDVTQGRTVTSGTGDGNDPLKDTRDLVESTEAAVGRLITRFEDLVALQLRLGRTPAFTPQLGLQFNEPRDAFPVPAPRLPLEPETDLGGTVPLPSAPAIEVVSEQTAALDDAMDRLARTMEFGLGDSIADAILNLDSLGDAFIALIRGIRQELAQQAGEGAAAFIFGLFKSGATVATGGAATGGAGGGAAAGGGHPVPHPSVVPHGPSFMPTPTVNLNVSAVDSASFMKAQNDVMSATAHNMAISLQRSRQLQKAMRGF